VLRLLLLIVVFASLVDVRAAEPHYPTILASLVDPAKIDTLKGDRATNPRLRKMAYWLEMACRAGNNPAEVILSAQQIAGVAGSARAEADRAALVRNRLILERLGCFTEEGLANLRRGKAPRITLGPYAGDIVHVDHIIPRAVAPELDLRIYNLEFMPATLNTRKGAGIGVRQLQLARKWHAAGLLSDSGLRAVLAHE
jgi:hypothetical protein